MNGAAPAVALISTGHGQSSGWDFPRKDVVDHVLLAEGACERVAPASAGRLTDVRLGLHRSRHGVHVSYRRRDRASAGEYSFRVRAAVLEGFPDALDERDLPDHPDARRHAPEDTVLPSGAIPELASRVRVVGGRVSRVPREDPGPRRQ
jgi:hypothetical protein